MTTVQQWGTPAIGKGTWPANRGRRNLIDRFLQRHRDQQPITITCGIDGCRYMVAEPFGDARLRLELHRTVVHPGWVAPKVKRG